MSLRALRDEFPVLRDRAYLNAGTDGPVPMRSVRAAGERLRLEAEQGRGDDRHWQGLAALSSELRTRLAALVNSEPGEVALTRSTTDGVEVVLAGLELSAGDEILTSDEEHPGLLGPLAGLRRRTGVTIRRAPFGRVADAITGRTRLIAVSHVSWMTGAIASIDDLRRANSLLLLDGAQGAGAMPVDVRALGCDFYAASGQKWLCGSNGSGFLFAAAHRLEQLGVPRPGYNTLAEGTDPLALEPREGARRLDSAPPAGPALAASLAALDMLAEAGWAAVFEQAASLATSLRRRLGGRALGGGPSPLVSWEVDGGPEGAREAVERLGKGGVVVRAIPGRPWLRASTGAWNDESDLDVEPDHVVSSGPPWRLRGAQATQSKEDTG